MTDPQIASLFILGLLGLILLRIHVGAALLLVSFTGIWTLFGWQPAVGALKAIPYNFAANWQLSAVPMFLFMGYLSYNTGITKGLFAAARVWLAKLPGGLAVASIFGSSGFAALTGSSVACAAAMGRIAVPEMLEKGYSPRLATGTVAAAGTIGALIPPSILLIVYGIVAQVPVGDLFLGGVVIGLITMLGYIGVVVIWAMLHPADAPAVTEHFSWHDRFSVLWSITPALLLALLIFGGLFSGIFTPTEAGAVGAAFCSLIAIGYRTLSWNAIRDALVETITTTAAIFIIAIGANLLARFITLSGADEYLSTVILQALDSRWMLLCGIVLVYLLLGMFLDPMGAMLMTLPILLPIVQAEGIELLWFGIFVVKLLEFGMITPPIGLNVFVIKSAIKTNIPLGTIFRGVFYFLLADIVIVALMIAVPDFITLLIPNK